MVKTLNKYGVFGPFEIEKEGSHIFNRASKGFWDDVEREAPGVSSAVGCYVFAIRAAKGVRPWYVGKTEKGTLKGESWAAHKLNLYNEALNSRKKGTALLYLIARYTKGGKFAKPRKSGRGDIRALENLLIGSCLSRNPELLNVKQTKYFRRIAVPGYMNAAVHSKSARGLKRLVGA